jgi:hypothetical protein
MNNERPEPATPPGGADDRDRDHLEEFERKLQLVRDRVAAIARGYSAGFYLYGSGGIGKSHAVHAELRRLRANYKPFNSRMTGRGLYDALRLYPDAVHVLEDVESLTRDRAAQGVLRLALWAPPGCAAGERPVTWSTRSGLGHFAFSGGVILVANGPLAALPELDAVRTRIAVMHLQASDAELRAMMRALASRGHELGGLSMDPGECEEVCEFVIAESLALFRPLDLRLLTNAFADYLQAREGDAACPWRDLVAARVRERPAAPRPALSRAGRKSHERQVAREVAAGAADRADRQRLWREQTDKSQASFYRRLTEANGVEAEG